MVPRLFVIPPVLGLLAVLFLFFKLPETPNLLSCKACSSVDPYLPLIGAGYFALLAAFSFLFPTLPGKKVAKGGLTWAIVLGSTLTYLSYPFWCPICLICHGCHILIWLAWLLTPPLQIKVRTPIRERLYLTFVAPLSVVALFSCLNLTFMLYDFQWKPPIFPVKPGDFIADFSLEFNSGAETYMINFIAPDCPYCKEQLPLLSEAAPALSKTKIINVCSELSADLVKNAPDMEWREDKDGKLRTLFKVIGYPTLYVVDKEGKIKEVIPGVPSPGAFFSSLY